MQEIRGLDLDAAGRCRHYHSERDVIALRCGACKDYYACYQCHDSLEDHNFKAIARQTSPLVLCGNCKNYLDWPDYHSGICPFCQTSFNPNCQLHDSIYFF